MSQPLSTPVRVGLGLLLMACGVLPILAAFDVGPLHQADIHGPPWLAAIAGSVFVLGGVTMFFANASPNHPLSYALMFVLLAGFAAMGNWIAFGPGPRECSVGFTSFMFSSARKAAEFECRAGFGVGAVIMDGILICMAAGAPKRFIGSGPFTETLDGIGTGALLLCLVPILLPLLVFGFGSSLLEALRERLATERWPRLDAMIARMTGKGSKS